MQPGTWPTTRPCKRPVLDALAANPEDHALLEALNAAVPSLQQLPGPPPQQLPGPPQEGGFPDGAAAAASVVQDLWALLQTGARMARRIRSGLAALMESMQSKLANFGISGGCAHGAFAAGAPSGSPGLQGLMAVSGPAPPWWPPGDAGANPGADPGADEPRPALSSEQVPSFFLVILLLLLVLIDHRPR
ncbi:hypothetical protein ABPG77_004509 [Micractinium sp. CCAP 211/92]